MVLQVRVAAPEQSREGGGLEYRPVRACALVPDAGSGVPRHLISALHLLTFLERFANKYVLLVKIFS